MTDHSALIERLEAGPQSGCAELPGWEELCAEAAAALRGLTEWRDIATAPKDGSSVLIFPHMDVAAWDFGSERWLTNVIPLNDDRTIADNWMARPVMMFEQYASNWGQEPTHWLPLPSAPNQAKEAGE